MCQYPIKCLLTLCPSNLLPMEQPRYLSIDDIITAVALSAVLLYPHSRFRVLIYNRSDFNDRIGLRGHSLCYSLMCAFVLSAGGGVQHPVCTPWTPVQEAVCGPLSGLCEERQRHAGWLCSAGAAQDGGPDAGLRPVHISKSREWRRSSLLKWRNKVFMVLKHLQFVGNTYKKML